MLIINADDLGRNCSATDRILECYHFQRITSASAMVFMEDSERAMALAGKAQLDIGLHINFSESFTGQGVSESIRSSHEKIRRFLRSSKYALLIYHPFLRKAFRDVFQAQCSEFKRLSGKMPSRYDGHQHMHLCSNVIVDRLLPPGVRVRRSFSFRAGEKSYINRAYRRAIDRQLARRHCLTDCFFALSQHLSIDKLRSVVALARTRDVELMTHPEIKTEFETLLSAGFAEAISEVSRVVCSRN